MEALKNFLQFSSPLDWLVIMLAAILILAGILMLILARSRRPIYWFLAAALLPLLLGMLTTYLKNRAMDKALAKVDSGTVEVGQQLKRLPPPPPPPPGGRIIPTPTPVPTPDLTLVVEAGRREAWLSTYVGAAGTIVTVLIGLFGLALKKKAA
jgi:hypothetical protein